MCPFLCDRFAVGKVSVESDGLFTVGGFKGVGGQGGLAPFRIWPLTTSRRSHLASLECKKTLQRPDLRPGPHQGS